MEVYVSQSGSNKASLFLNVKKYITKFIPLFGLIIMILFFQITTKGKILSINNLRLLFKQGFALLIATTAGVFVMSTGNLDFSIGANLGFCASVACFAAFVHPYLALPVAIITGIAVGFINGAAQVLFKLPSFIACLCMMFILMALNQTLTGGGSKMIPVDMMRMDNSTINFIAIIIYMVVMIILFRYTKVGKYLKAIGISNEASIQSGVKTGKMIFVAYMITGAAAGIAGYFTLLRTGAAAPSIGTTTTTDVIIAIVLGGMTISGGASSKISAAILGTITITILNSGITLSGMGGEAQQLVKGLIFIVVVAVSSSRDKNTIIK